MGFMLPVMLVTPLGVISGYFTCSSLKSRGCCCCYCLSYTAAGQRLLLLLLLPLLLLLLLQLT